MAKSILGKIAITPRNEWNALTADYEYLDSIKYLGSAYLVNLKNGFVPVGTLPTNEAYFMNPDASYDGTAASTGSRIFVGMTAGSTNLTGADVLAAIGVGFRRVHNFGGVQHANWFFSSRNSTTETLVNTGMAFVAGHQYTFSIFSPAGASSVTWEIENVITGDVATGVATQTLPALMTRMRPAASVGTINAVARSMWFQSLYAEADF